MNGISTVIKNLYINRYFQKEEITFIFPLGSNEEQIREMKDYGFNIICLERNSKPLRYYFKLKRILKEGSFDIVHVNGNSATNAVELLAAKRAGISVRIMHNHSVQCKYRLINIVFKPMLNNLCNVRYASGEKAGEFLFGKRRYEIINNGFSLKDYEYNFEKRNRLREQFNISNEIVIGHVGGFNCQKNQKFLVEIFIEYRKVNSNAILFLVGEGPLKKDVQRQVEEAGLINSVIFAGNRRDVQDLLNIFDCFVFPSRSESLGIAPIEAQVNGLPVIASNSVPKVVKINNNFVFLPLKESPAVWAKRLLSMKLNREQNAPHAVALAGFDIEEIAKALHEKYVELKERKCK
jgi:glycosyltransferase involved in cell wall biosynthesis